MAGIANGGQWSENDVKQWTLQALERFPLLRPVLEQVTADADNQDLFSLPKTVQGVVSVYHVERAVQLTSGNFMRWDDTGSYYSFVNRSDATAMNDLMLSEGAALSIGAGDTLRVETMQQHDYELADDDPVTVPSHQLHLIQKLVTIIALTNRVTYHAQSLTQQDMEWMTAALGRLQEEYADEVDRIPEPLSVSPWVAWTMPDD
ncbi:MAG: hypothetical protein KDE51_04505 [Anaerolineales bacterium]|nr:hypothetical protein [Anaerolineales bacterium]